MYAFQEMSDESARVDTHVFPFRQGTADYATETLWAIFI